MIKITIPKMDITHRSIEKCEHDNQIRREKGIYLFHNKEKDLMYVGKTSNLHSRIKGHKEGSEKSNTYRIKHNFKYYSVIYCGDAVERDILETFIINELKPKLNVAKVWTYESDHYSEEYYKETESDIREQEAISEAYLSIEV